MDEFCKEYTKAVQGENSEFNATQLMMTDVYGTEIGDNFCDLIVTRYKQEYNESLEAYRHRITGYQNILNPDWENDVQMCKKVARMLAVGLNDKTLFRAVAQKDFDNVESFMEFCRRQANVEETVRIRFNEAQPPLNKESPMEIDHLSKDIKCFKCGKKDISEITARKRKRSKPLAHGNNVSAGKTFVGARVARTR